MLFITLPEPAEAAEAAEKVAKAELVDSVEAEADPLLPFMYLTMDSTDIYKIAYYNLAKAVKAVMVA